MGEEVKRKFGFRKVCLNRDNYTCQKCKLEDSSGKKLEIHHILPLIFDGCDDVKNMITLCFNCHRHAPNEPEKFKEYMDSELDGLTTSLLFVYKKLQDEGVITDTSYYKLKNSLKEKDQNI